MPKESGASLVFCGLVLCVATGGHYEEDTVVLQV